MYTSSKWLLFLIIFCSLILVTVNLGAWAFMDFDEAIYAQVFAESVKRNDFLTFTYLGKPFLDKPPLYFWLAKGATVFFGENEFALRLPSALLTVLAVFLVWRITYVLTQKSRSAFFSSTVLLTTGYFLFAGRQLRLDVPVTTALLLALYSFIAAQTKPKWYIGFTVGVSSAILFKSVFALLIVPILLIFSWVYQKWNWVKNKYFWASIFATMILVVPWHIYQYRVFGSQFFESRYFSNLTTRLGGSVVLGPDTPKLYHIQQLFLTTNPWAFVFVIAALILTAQYVFGKRLNKTSDEQRFAIFTLLAAAGIIGSFFIFKNLLLYYLVPALPFMAMGIGVFLGRLFEQKRGLFLIAIAPFFVIGCMNTALQIFSPIQRNLLFQPTTKVTRTQVANEERVVARAMAEAKLPVYVYRWQFFPTLIYYSGLNPETALLQVKKGASLAPPFLLFVPTPLFRQQLPIEMPKNATVEMLFQHQAATLLKVTTP